MSRRLLFYFLAAAFNLCILTNFNSRTKDEFRSRGDLFCFRFRFFRLRFALIQKLNHKFKNVMLIVVGDISVIVAATATASLRSTQNVKFIDPSEDRSYEYSMYRLHVTPI